MNELTVMIIRLLVTAVLAAVIGIERETKDQPAGLRTHLLVGVGSCMLMLLSLYGFEPYLTEGMTIDPSRVPSYVVSGLGFLGAGTIIVNGTNVKGLTTAASIWTVAGIGLVVGAGMYELGIISTVIVFISLAVIRRVIKWIERKTG